MTQPTILTDRDIAATKRILLRQGDLRAAVICDRALGTNAYQLNHLGQYSERDAAAAAAMTIEGARAIIASVKRTLDLATATSTKAPAAMTDAWDIA